ncbi:hypothetical protein D9758_002887 [Tetrapyrgos nigripes]|uniref:Uncharacterized protein n=1 Tax=Tetrapyrgos nigripes TaxID=182062 RepID=A0A8H5GPR8_9AGAR|nr:hypothetical protein D9758_002887 [Tetrapyrgos nigripes]
MPSYNPCLPEDLIRRFKSDPHHKSTLIFSKCVETLRLEVLVRSPNRGSQDREVSLAEPEEKDRRLQPILDSLTGLLKNLQNFQLGARKTYLHLALKRVDLPLAYEMIRMGVTIDIKDKDGVTPLLYALATLRGLQASLETVTDPSFSRSSLRNVPKVMQDSLKPAHIKKMEEIIARIAILLIEQHADLDTEAFGWTPLFLTVLAQQWDLVKLLLLHGVHRPDLHDSRISPPDRHQLSSLMNEVKAANPRPPRPCPCWSGKPSPNATTLLLSPILTTSSAVVVSTGPLVLVAENVVSG